MDDWPRAPGATPVAVADVPFFPQDRYQCGPATLAEVLDFTGLKETPESLEPDLYIPAEKGTLQVEMLAQARRRGRMAYVIEPKPSALVAELGAGHPVLVLENLGLSWIPSWHYAVVTAYHPDDGGLSLHSGPEPDHQVSFYTFEHTWSRSDHWGMVVLKPGELPAGGDALRYAGAVSALETGSDAATAAPAWEAGVKRWPDSLELGFGLGNNRFSRADYAGAEQAFTAVLAAHPDAAPVYNNLAYTLAAQGRFDDAVQAATRAVQVGGADAVQYQDTLREMRCRAAGQPASCTP